MFKNVKKVLFAIVLSFIAVFALACGEEVTPANKENCKDYCDACTELNKENCKDYCDACEKCPECEKCTPANAENCKEFQEIVKPTGFLIDRNLKVKVGAQTAIFVDDTEWEPEDCYKGLIWVSEDPEIATVDAQGNVTGVKPGKVNIVATSAVNPELSESCAITVDDALKGDEIVNRELKYVVAQLPAYVTKTYTLPSPWNPSVKVTYQIDSDTVTEIVVPADLAAEVKNSVTITVKYGDSETTTTVNIWVVKDADLNSYVRVERAVDAAKTILGEQAVYYVLATEFNKDVKYCGSDEKELTEQPTTQAEFEAASPLYIRKAALSKISADLVLPPVIFGCTMAWSSSNTTVLTNDGKYTRPNDDKNIDLGITCQYGAQSKTYTFNVIAKGYDKDEKLAYIIENGSLANIAGKSFNTSIVLPDYDDKFNAKLTYVSSDTTVFTNDGKLVAPVTAEKEVKFTVTADYSFASSAAAFKETKEFTVKAIPATAASAIAEAAVQASAFKAVAHAPYGATETNLLALPTTTVEGASVKWDISKAKLEARLAEEPVDAFVQTEAGVKINVQYLRYTQVQILGTFTAADKSTATVTLFANIGICESPMTVLTGTWRSSAQKDKALSEIQGAYDTVGNVSYFDKKIGHVTESYGSGWWSGYVLTSPEYEGKVWQTFMMEQMTGYIREDADGKIYLDPANLNAGNGGNWGIFYVNTTDKAVNLEVGTYANADKKYSDGNPISETLGSRLNFAMDGYAPGFVADATGKIIAGSGNEDKLEYGMDNNRAYVGGKDYKAGAIIDAVLYSSLSADYKAKFEVQYRASENMMFVEDATNGTFQEVKDAEGKVTGYVAYVQYLYEKATEFAAGTEYYDAKGVKLTTQPADATAFAAVEGGCYVQVANTAKKYAPTYAKDAALTETQYTALTAEQKALVVVEYKAKEAVKFVVENLIVDSLAGKLVNYLTIPAKGYAMSWKYQFYGVGAATTLRAFCQTGTTITVEHYDVHPLNDCDTESLTAAIKAANTEAAVISARKKINALDTQDQKDVAGLAALVALEKEFAAKFDADVMEMAVLDETSRVFMNTMPSIITRYEALTAELKANLTKTAEYTAAKKTFDENCFVITLEYDGGSDPDFKDTITYTSLDGEVKLPSPTKKDFTFVGWFEDDLQVVTYTASKAKNVKLFAHWKNNTEITIENVLDKYSASLATPVDYTPVFYGAKANSSACAYGTAADQYANQGFSGMMVLVGTQAFILGEGSTIDLGKGITANKDLKLDDLRPVNLSYTYHATSKSIGLERVEGVVNERDTFGYGVLYYNSSDYELKFVLGDAYGRHSGLGDDFGYVNVSFTYDETKKAYVTSKIGDGATVEFTMKPKQYLWCPFYAERQCFNLTTATKDGSAVKGVLAEGTEVQIVDYANYDTKMEIETELNGGAWKYTSVDAVKADLLADYNAYAKPATAYTLTTIPEGNFSNVDFDDMFYSSKEMFNKWSWIFPYFEQNGGTDFNKKAFKQLAVCSTPAELEKSDSLGTNFQYSISYEIRAFLSGKEFRKGDETYASALYDATLAGKVLDSLKGTKLSLNIHEELPSPVKDGKVFMGWYKEAAFTTRVYTAESNAKLYAKFADTKNEFVIKFVDQGETYVINVVAKDAAIVAPTAPVKKGFTFLGWSLVQGGTKVDLPATATADATFYSVYERESFFDTTYVDAVDGGSVAATYKTLEEALSHTNANGTVNVKAGSYAGAVINKDGIKVIGANANTALYHDSTFASGATDSVITSEISIAKDVKNVTIKGLVMKNQITLLGNENVVISNIISESPKFDSALDGSVRIMGVSKNVSVDHLYLTGALANRGVYINAKTTDFTITDSCVLDGATGSVDFLRFGQGNSAYAVGTVTMTNCYVTSSQSAIMDRVPAATKYVIEHNYFKNVPAAIYMRGATITTPVEYVCQYNTFDGCGDLPNDWDVAAFTTSATTKVAVHYNSFIRCFAVAGTATDYLIKVRSAAGEIDCANNYCDTDTQKTMVSNATNVSWVDAAALKAAVYNTVGNVVIEKFNKQMAEGTIADYEGICLLKKGTGLKSSLNWIKIGICKNVKGEYVVTAVVASGADLAGVGSYDYLLTAWSSTANYKALVDLGIAVGDVVEFSADVTTMATGAGNGLTLNVYRAK